MYVQISIRVVILESTHVLVDENNPDIIAICKGKEILLHD